MVNVTTHSDSVPPAAKMLVARGAHIQSVNSLACEVIDRLASRARGTRRRDHLAVNGLASALLKLDGGREALRLVQGQLALGAEVERVYLEDMVGAVNQIGAAWERGDLSATNMTQCANRMVTLMHALSARADMRSPRLDLRAVLAPVPGEPHNLGVQMAADLMQRDGWQIELMLDRSQDQLLSDLSRCDSGLLGLSVTCDAGLGALAPLLTEIRVRRPDLRVLVAGQMMSDPEIAATISADATAGDYATARDRMLGLSRDLRAGVLHS
ncbi:MAG: hypothetical protein AAGA05_03925 [Pseudomonadota bacterium]